MEGAGLGESGWEAPAFDEPALDVVFFGTAAVFIAARLSLLGIQPLYPMDPHGSR